MITSNSNTIKCLDKNNNILTLDRSRVVSRSQNNQLKVINISNRLKTIKAYKLQLNTLGYVVNGTTIDDSGKNPYMSTIHHMINLSLNIKSHENYENLIFRVFKNPRVPTPTIKNSIQQAFAQPRKGNRAQNINHNTYYVAAARLARTAKRKNITLDIEKLINQ